MQASSTSSGPLPVCSAVWFRHHCRHERVFQSEYQRSNRNHGVKILRCFPHCCPGHIERSYCGSGVQLAVALDPPLANTADQIVSVIARFEPEDNDEILRIGELYSMHSLMKTNNQSPRWFHGLLQPSEDPQTRIFHINEQSTSRWFYHWRSGANKAQRFTKHVLRGYILYERLRDEGTPDGVTATDERDTANESVRVVGIACSTPFTLVSHRRSVSLNESARATIDAWGSLPLTLHAFRQYQARHQEASTQQTHSSDEASLEDDGEESVSTQRPGRPVLDLYEDHLFQANRRKSILEPLKDLAIIFRFVSGVSVFDMMPNFCVREHIYASIREHCISSNIATTIVATVLAMGTSKHPRRAVITSSMDDLLIKSLKLVVWALSETNIDWARLFFDSHADTFADTKRREGIFLSLVEEMIVRLNVFWKRTIVGSVHGFNATAGLRKLSSHLVTLAHREHRFDYLWPSMRELLEDSSTSTTWFWQPFVAQLRETYLRKQVHPSVSVCTLRAAGGVAGEWELDASSFNIYQPDDALIRTHSETLSAWNVLLVAARFARWRLAVRDDDVLLIQCEKSLLPVEDAWMSLICDTTIRTTSVLPLGLARLAGSGWFRGSVSQSGEKYLLEFALSSSGQESLGHRFVVSLGYKSPTDSLDIVVECYHAEPQRQDEDWGVAWRAEATMRRREESMEGNAHPNFVCQAVGEKQK